MSDESHLPPIDSIVGAHFFILLLSLTALGAAMPRLAAQAVSPECAKRWPNDSQMQRSCMESGGARAITTGIQSLTADTLKEAVRAADSADAAKAIEQYTPIGAVVRQHGMLAIIQDPRLDARFKRMADGPFTVTILSPFVSAMLATTEAKRKYQPPPALDVAALNAQKVVVQVSPGSKLFQVDTIEDMVIKRGGQIVRPLRKTVEPTVLQNAMGASVSSARGSFTFDFATFAPTEPITLVLIGNKGNVEWDLAADELKWLR